MAYVRGTTIIPEAARTIDDTPLADIDAAIEDLNAHKHAWLAVDADARAEMLDRMIDTTVAASTRWAEESCIAKGYAVDSREAGEEWVHVSFVARNLRLLRDVLRDIANTGKPAVPGPIVSGRNGQAIARVFPTDEFDELLYPGFTADVWMQPGVLVADVPDTMAVQYSQSQRPAGSVCFVLGAGNVSSIGAMDALYKLFVENQVVLIKMNPVNAYLGPIINDALGELIEGGYMRVVHGGATEGAYCAAHAKVDTLHMTGSDKTHDAVVFGAGEAGKRNKQAGQPQNAKPFTSELGNVTPVIVVPGPWSSAEVAFHGENIATMLSNNAGFNCGAARLIVNHAEWDQRGALLDQIRKSLAETPLRRAYYPGANDRFDAFVTSHPEAEQFGDAADGQLPWTLIPDLDASDSQEPCFTTEAFCGVFGEVGLRDYGSIPDFIDAAVEFCNDVVWGSLSVTIIVHPESLEDASVKAAVDRAVENLRYGGITFNHWGSINYGLVTPTWGAFPGHTIDDIQSGRGVVHNIYMFDRAEKSVLYAPFSGSPVPPWFASHSGQLDVMRLGTPFQGRPSMDQLPAIGEAAARA